ncbi:MAG TPA: recombinase family protein [Chloroflexia bacterium]|nr:recombinase family protein [Chloroflexia bacterium]
MRVAIYARVSTLRQAQAQTIEQQLERLRDHLNAAGWEVADRRIFRDDGYSGAALHRPGLDRLRDAVAAGEVDRVLLTAPDRLARNYVHQALLLEEFERGGCAVEFLDRPMSQDPHDQLLLQIRGAVAEYERSVIAERMRRGRQMKLRAGLLLPWTRAPYGYRLDPDRPRDPAGVRIEAAEAAVVQELFATYLEEGTGLIGLAKALSRRGLVTPNGHTRWNAATVRGMLTNPSYTGQVYAGRSQARPPRGRHSALRPIGRPGTTSVPVPREAWIPVATIPALVGADQFEQVQAKLARNRQFARRNNTARDYLLRALVSCGHCRTACAGRSDRKQRYDYYVCRAKANPVAAHRDEHCPARYIPVQVLDGLVWQDLCAVLPHPESIAEALARAQGGHWSSQDLQARRELLRQGQVGLDQQVERLTDAYLGGIMPLAEYRRRRGEVEQKQRGLAQQREHLEAQAARAGDLAAQVRGAEEFCQRIRAGLADASFAQKRHLVELLIDRVVVTDDEVEIRYVVPTGPRGEHTRFCHLRLDYFDRPGPARRASSWAAVASSGARLVRASRTSWRTRPVARATAR